MRVERGTLVRNKATQEVGIILDIKVWKATGYDLTRKLSNKIFSSRHFSSILKTKVSNSIDFYVHWASGSKTWIISSSVLLLEYATN